MKKVLIGLAVFFILIFLTIGVMMIIDNYNLKQQHEKKRLFEKQMVRNLGLTYCNSDPSYRGPYTRIFKDTIMGYRFVIENNSGPEYFFFQSIKNPSYKVKLIRNRRNDLLPTENYITYFNNGCMYFGTFGGSTMERICIDGSTKQYFRNYADTLFYANKVLIYKNKAAITSMNGMYVFDMDNEKLLWKYKHEKPNDLYDGSSSIINNKFYFSDKHQRINCLNLDNMQMEWQTQLVNTGLLRYFGLYQELGGLYHTDKYLVLPGTSKLIIMELNTGKIVWTYEWYMPWYFQPKFDVVGDYIYFTYEDKVECINFITNKRVFRIKNAIYQGEYKNYIIAKSKNSQYYVIANKNNGALKKLIENPNVKDELIHFVDKKYVIVNRETIYK
jgi:hypothetical protein